jgi:hypothetical protein
VAEANQAVAAVVDSYIAGLPPEWTVVDRTEDLGYGDSLNAQAEFRQAIPPTASASRCMRTCEVGLPP